jgi:hypothetical protein
VRKDGRDDMPFDDPRSDSSDPDVYSGDHCHSAPDVGLYNDDIRLWRLGIDSDKMTSLDIMIELQRRMAEIKKKEAEQEKEG